MTHGGSHHLDLTFAERERAAVPGETPGIHKDAASEDINHGSPPDPTLIDYVERVFGVTGVEQTHPQVDAEDVEGVMRHTSDDAFG